MGCITQAFTQYQAIAAAFNAVVLPYSQGHS